MANFHTELAVHGTTQPVASDSNNTGGPKHEKEQKTNGNRCRSCHREKGVTNVETHLSPNLLEDTRMSKKYEVFVKTRIQGNGWEG